MQAAAEPWYEQRGIMSAESKDARMKLAGYRDLAMLWIAPQIAVIAAPATLDLRPFSENRGTDPGRAAEKPKLTLTRKRLQLALYFPVGMDEGQYTLQLLDGQLHTLLKQSVNASLQNHIVSATADLDLRSITPGAYTLALRKTGDEWRTFPVLLE